MLTPKHRALFQAAYGTPLMRSEEPAVAPSAGRPGESTENPNARQLEDTPETRVSTPRS